MNEVTPQLWVSDIAAVRTHPLPEEIDRVVSTCQDSAEDNVSVPYDHFKMADGPDDGHVRGDHTYPLFEEAVDRVVSALEDGEIVMVHCHMGRSRSVAVAIAAIATVEDVGYWDAYDTVRQGRGHIQPNQLLVEHVREYIDETEPYAREA